MKSSFTCFKFVFVATIIALLPATAFPQFTPLAVSGFNHDVIAESGNNSLATTSIPLDGITVSNKIMYSTTFKNLNSFGGGGLPDNGFVGDITSGTYHLAPYTSNNALLLQRNQTGDLTINSPARYKSIRIAAFSTEGPSLINVTLFFADGTSSTALTNYTLQDWFNGTTNVVSAGFGRCNRVSGVTPSDADAFPGNPRLYYIDVPFSCADRAKSLQSVHLENVTTAGSNAPYPNAVFMAVSGDASVTTIYSTSSNAGPCSLSITLGISGSSQPFMVSWNTIPVQIGNTATFLTSGFYTATITDAAGCITTWSNTIVVPNNITISMPLDTTICFGASFNSTITSNATGYNWLPITGVSNPFIVNPVFSPSVSTTYTLMTTLGNCSSSKSFTVTVDPEITLKVHADTTICLGASFNANTISDGTSYSWLPVTGVSDPSIANPVLSPTTTTTYTVTSTKGNCSNTKTFKVTVVPGITVSAGNSITIIEGQSVQLQGSASAGTYLWTPPTGLSATNILNPIAKPLVTTTYTLRVTTALGCTGTDDMDVIVVPYCLKPMNAITPNGDGINDKWLVTDGNCISNARVHIYNRYGSAVYENKDYKNDWQGTYKGKPVPDGTYYFVIEYKLLDGRDVQLKGDLTILR